MVMDINMFAVAMKLRVAHKCNSTTIVIMEIEWMVRFEAKLTNQHLMPEDMSGSMGKGNIFSF